MLGLLSSSVLAGNHINNLFTQKYLCIEISRFPFFFSTFRCCANSVPHFQGGWGHLSLFITPLLFSFKIKGRLINFVYFSDENCVLSVENQVSTMATSLTGIGNDTKVKARALVAIMESMKTLHWRWPTSLDTSITCVIDIIQCVKHSIEETKLSGYEHMDGVLVTASTPCDTGLGRLASTPCVTVLHVTLAWVDWQASRHTSPAGQVGSRHCQEGRGRRAGEDKTCFCNWVNWDWQGGGLSSI